MRVRKLTFCAELSEIPYFPHDHSLNVRVEYSPCLFQSRHLYNADVKYMLACIYASLKPSHRFHKLYFLCARTPIKYIYKSTVRRAESI